MSVEIIPTHSSITLLNSAGEKSAIKPEYNQKLVHQALAIVKAYQTRFENDVQSDFEDCGLFSGREIIYGVMKAKETAKQAVDAFSRACFKKPS